VKHFATTTPMFLTQINTLMTGKHERGDNQPEYRDEKHHDDNSNGKHKDGQRSGSKMDPSTCEGIEPS